jgi:two-component system KDP operon response regulator KdpE
MMPDIRGAEALRLMRALRPTLRVVVISGHQDGVSRREIDECGVEGFLAKPFVMDELAAAVREALDREQPVSGAGVLPRSPAG